MRSREATVRNRRIIKVWTYVAVMFCVVSSLVLVLTGEPRAVLVIAGVNVALGCLGTFIAWVTPDKLT
jgi:hypothetical protein